MDQNTQYRIRTARAEDTEAMGEVYALSWKAAYRGIFPDEYLDNLTGQRWAIRFAQNYDENGELEPNAPQGTIMEIKGRIIGACHCSRARDTDLDDSFAEIISAYLLPEYWRQGLGSALLSNVMEQLEKSFRHCVLWTLTENERARRAYERMNFYTDGSSKIFELAGIPAEEIRYRHDF